MHLITPTLLNNFRFYKNYEGENVSDKRQEFLNMLAKLKVKPNEAQQTGIDFEKAVYDLLHGDFITPTSAIIEVADMVRGGLWQERVKRKLGNYLLYGKIDVVLRDTACDIKRVMKASSYETGKYSDSMQHRIYMYCSKLHKFEYIVSDGQSVWTESYRYNIEMENDIINAIHDLEAYMEADKEAKALFEKHWQAYE